MIKTLFVLISSISISSGCNTTKENNGSGYNEYNFLPNYATVELKVSKSDVKNTFLPSLIKLDKEVERLFKNRKFKELERLAQTLLDDNLADGTSAYSRYMYSLSGVLVSLSEPSETLGELNSAQLLKEWEKQTPNSSHYKLAKLKYLISLAWKYRGSGYANTVTKEQFSKFHNQLRIAKKYAEIIKPEVNNPQWYVDMLAIYKGLELNGRDYLELANTAILLYPTFYEVYFRAADYLAPWWFGSKETLERFMFESANSLKDSDGLAIYARIFWTQHQPSHRLLFNRDLMRASMLEIVNKYPDEWNVQNLAKISCEIKDAKTTKELLSLINMKPLKSVWSPMQYDVCKMFVQLNDT